MADPGFPVGGGGADPLGGVDLRHGHFSVKTYAKTKELDLVRGRPPGSANDTEKVILIDSKKMDYFLHISLFGMFTGRAACKCSITLH